MNVRELWNTELNRETGKQFEEFHRYLYALNDGSMNVEGLLATPYGDELARRLLIRCRIENDPKEAEKYYASIGLKCEFHAPEQYFDRWKLFIPLELEKDRRYPLLFWNHGGGNSIESEETMTGYLQIAAREGFLLAMLQNTNADQVLRVLDYAAQNYPVDTQRVYMGGFSQGSAQCHSCYTHHPGKIAAVALTCSDLFRPWDNFDELYTQQELDALKEQIVPLSLQVGACEPFPFAPLNDWHKNRMNPIPREMRGRPDDFEHPGKNQDMDPTRITTPGKGRYEPGRPNVARMANMYEPSEGEDPHVWSVRRANRRLELLNCAPRDVERCAQYFFDADSAIHKATGIYGDQESVETLLGVKHYIVRIKNRDGLDAFQYIVTENNPHWPQVTAAELGWAFLKRFRRDPSTGKIIQE
jgi:pimeloyl-ACP methyl ester carboxylesterase